MTSSILDSIYNIYILGNNIDVHNSQFVNVYSKLSIGMLTFRGTLVIRVLENFTNKILKLKDIDEWNCISHIWNIVF